MNSPSNSPFGGRADTDDVALVRAYLADNPRLSKGAVGAARHFLEWARTRKIPTRDLDASAVDRFLRHRCRCGRYSPAQLRKPAYATDTRRFLSYLEATGVVFIANEVARLGQYLEAYAGKLSAVGYSKVTYSTLLSQARHFAEWALADACSGPRNLANTYWYLEATPVLLKMIASTAEETWMGGVA